MTPDTALSIDLHGQRALVTGGTRGMGRAIATRLAQAGAAVLTTARTAPEPALDTDFVAADVRTPEGAETIAGAARDRLGGVDWLVHNAGASFARPGGALVRNDEYWWVSLNPN